MSFKQKMMLLLVSVGIIPMLFVFSVTTYFASNDLEQQAFSKLKAVQEIKSSSIRVYLNRLTTEVHLLSTDPEIINVLEHFDHAYQVAQLNPQRIAEERNALRVFYLKEFLPRLQKNRPSADSSYIDNLLHGLNDKDVWFQYRYLVSNSHPVGEKDKLIHSGKGDEYDQYHQHVQNYLRGIQKEYGFYDIFLINNEGEILYSVFKETDFATSLTHGPYKDSGLAKAYKKAKQSQSGQAIMVDFQRYVPSYDNPAAFIASPIYTPKGKLIGVLAAQFPVEDLNAMMSSVAVWEKLGSLC